LSSARDGKPIKLSKVGLYKLNAVDPWLESAWFQPLNLKCDFLAFKFNLYRYATVDAGLLRLIPERDAMAGVRHGGSVQVECS
jgi:hypothetical protein